MSVEQPIRVAFAGATGSVGRVLVPLILESPEFTLVGALGRNGVGLDIGTFLGREPAQVVITDDMRVVLSEDPQVIIDYSAPEPSARWCLAAVEARVAAVIATTAVAPAAVADIGRIAERNGVGVFMAGNLSIGVHLMKECAALLGRYMNDAEIVEGHSTAKTDSPSGTTFEIAEVLNDSKDPQTVWDSGTFSLPESRGAQLGRVHVHSLRMLGLASHHEIYFSRLGELVSIRADTLSPMAFAGPTLKAAKRILGERGLVHELSGIYEPD